MTYILFALIFCGLLTLVIWVKKQNQFFKQHGLKVIGRVVALEEKTMQRPKGGGSYTVQLPVIEYPHKGQTWQLHGDASAPQQYKEGEIVNLVVHPELPIAMTEKELEQRNILLLVLTGLLIVPIGLILGFHSLLSGDAAQMMMFKGYGITVGHFYDFMGGAALLTFLVKMYPIWKRWKEKQDQAFMGLPYNVKAVSPKNTMHEQQAYKAHSG
ncbi:DUF3592 domain-containing protein [Acinetobacter towneri]|uniref:DUF3592 domain-containing protein n=1 Tax=Acinetobacter TaxID=469 RepID=UPI0015D29187|nr:MULTISPECIES: DUF3592 domain-containing protein [Acinetobacter]MDM1283793.1 DUF3592 domain-containing protein [Acinetobacter towneri]